MKYEKRHSITDTGTPYQGGEGPHDWRRIDTITPRDPAARELTECVHVADAGDDSPTVNDYAHRTGRTDEPGAVAYNGEHCACCWLNIPHSVRLHENATRERRVEILAAAEFEARNEADAADMRERRARESANELNRRANLAHARMMQVREQLQTVQKTL